MQRNEPHLLVVCCVLTALENVVAAEMVQAWPCLQTSVWPSEQGGVRGSPVSEGLGQRVRKTGHLAKQPAVTARLSASQNCDIQCPRMSLFPSAHLSFLLQGRAVC